MKKIKSIPRIETNEKSVQFDFEYEDSTSESFELSGNQFSSFILDASAVSWKELQSTQADDFGHKVAYEHGTGRVLFQLVLPNKDTVNLVLGHTRASTIADQLREAAEKSTVPQEHH